LIVDVIEVFVLMNLTAASMQIELGEPIGNVVRFYYSTKGEHITRVSNGGKVPFSTDSVPVIELPDNIPDDLDYSRYIEESEKLLKNVGFDNKVA
jgi:hypothetical protein